MGHFQVNAIRLRWSRRCADSVRSSSVRIVSDRSRADRCRSESAGGFRASRCRRRSATFAYLITQLCSFERSAVARSALGCRSCERTTMNIDQQSSPVGRCNRAEDCGVRLQTAAEQTRGKLSDQSPELSRAELCGGHLFGSDPIGSSSHSFFFAQTHFGIHSTAFHCARAHRKTQFAVRGAKVNFARTDR